MSVVVFSGPSLAPAEGRRLLPDALFSGPAGQGDIYDACRSGATVVALIDGYFEHRLAPWHKEILWALKRGVAVYGAASLGALRAAELAPFGMRGVGAIYQRVASGEIEDDDEVVLVHHGADRDYAPQSEALVDIRFTIEAAREAGIVSPQYSGPLLNLGRSMFYPRRSMRALLERSREVGLPEDERRRLATWLGASGQARVQQKRDDARLLLGLLATSGAPASGCAFDFAYTEVWHELRRERDGLASGTRKAEGASVEPAPEQGSATQPQAELPDEEAVREGLRLAGELQLKSKALHDSVIGEAAVRALRLHVASERPRVRSVRELQLFSEQFRQQQGLLTPEETTDWLKRQGLTLKRFSRFLHEELQVLEGHAAAARLLAASIPGVLRRRDLLASRGVQGQVSTGRADTKPDHLDTQPTGTPFGHLQSPAM